MSRIDIETIYKNTLEHYEKAKGSIPILEHCFSERAEAISDVVPGYKADFLEFGSYDKDNFTVLFVDMRNSTKRAKQIGAQNTFLTMHAYIPALLEVVKEYGGKVVDIMGDGIMAFFGGKTSGVGKVQAVKNAGLCGKDMLVVRESVINRILNEDGIEWGVDMGVGVDYGDVIVSKIGIDDFYDVKAFGDCINKASKYSDCYNQVKVSKQIKELWPSSNEGKLKFISLDNGESYFLS